MRVIVTGGAGYIGCWATMRMLDVGWEPVVLDKMLFVSGQRYVQSLGVECHEVDIRDVNLKDYGQFDAIVHLAGLSNDPVANYSERGNHEMNVVATERICQQAHDSDCTRFIFASSASVYGWNSQPKLDETAPLKPVSYYAESKARAEEYVLQIGGTVLRQATVMSWSPRHRNDLVVNAMVKSCLETGRINVNGGGEAVRPLVEVRDLAETYVRLLDAPAAKVSGQVFNVNHRRADGDMFEGYTVASLALWIKHILESKHGVKAEVVGNWDGKEGRSYDMTSRKLRAVLDWEPQLGVSAAVDSIVEHRHELRGYDQVNIEWMKALEHGQRVTQKTGRVFL